MTKLIAVFSALTLLVACGDPLAKVDKLSSVELADDAVTVGALPDPAQNIAPTGLFSGLFGGRAEPAPVVASAAIETENAVETALASAPTTPQMATAPIAQPQKRGLFGFMRAKEAAQPAVPVEQIVAPPALAQTVAVEPAKLAAVTVTAPTAVAKPRKGLFGMLAGARAKDIDANQSAQVRTASLGPVPTSQSAAKKQAVFGKRTAKHKGPDVQIVPYGSILPSGAIARVCDLPGGRLGKEVGKFPERGRGYKMFDSNPSAAGARPFYVTGFDDKCARTFTAALALFGSPMMHEQLRYGLPSSVQPYSTTDKAYEGVKRSVCGVGKKKACGAKIKLLEKDTVFISIYDRIGSNSKWSNVLLHKGWVLAADRKG